MATRAEDLATAYMRVARANHYMVGIVDPAVTDDELSAAEQILIAGQNALTGAPGGRAWHSQQFARHELALDMLEAERRRRTSAASRGVG